MAEKPALATYWREVTAIIESGLKPDPVRVAAFAEHFADRLEETGETRLAQRIKRLTNGAAHPAGSTFRAHRVPSDIEAHQALIEVTDPHGHPEYPILPPAAASELRRFVELNKRSGELQTRGVDPPTSLLLFGPPGCGKTMAAVAAASDLRLPLLTVRLDSLLGSYLGNSAKNLWRVFDDALAQPSILLLDEFDAIGKMRDDAQEVGEIKRLVSSLLQNLDRVRGRQVVIAATNHHHMLDSAIWRRFDIVLQFEKPGREELRQIVSDLLANEPSPKAIIDALATLSMGLSGSEVALAVKRAQQDRILHPQEALVRLLTAGLVAYKRGQVPAVNMRGKKDLILAVHEAAGDSLTIRQIARLCGCSAPYVHELLSRKEGLSDVK